MDYIDKIGEFGFIKFLLEDNKDSFYKVIKGIGDDCAVFEKDKEKAFLVSTEIFVEDIHFLKAKISPYELGIKVVNASLSDIAAMAGTPLYLFVSIALPRDTKLAYLTSLYRGIKDSCNKYKVHILGGDTSASPEKLVINIVVIGEAKKEQIIYRKGAKPNDLIYVTGNLGDSAAGLMLIKKEISVSKEVANKLISAHNMPSPRLEIGKLVSKYSLANAMIDISDGLVADLNHICEASNMGAIIYLENIPISSELESIKNILSISPYDLALYGGEDYELIIIVPQDKALIFESLCRKEGFSVYLIGRIVKEKGIKLILDNKCIPLDIRGYTHF